MVKMKMFRAYNMENVPDHIVEELKIHLEKLHKAIYPVIDNVDCNLTLSAMNHLMAIMIKHYISDDPKEIKKAALVCTNALFHNIKFYTGVDIFEGDPDL